jgi:thioredoxin-dependent peroxiredoxin
MTILKAGDQAPPFTLPNQAGQTTTLTQFEGKYVVLYYYPRDNTPGCTVEAIDFTKYKQQFTELNATIIGVSKDTVKSHCSFISKKELKIILLSDENHKMQEEYGVWRPKKFMGREFLGTVRSTFLIDPQGKIVYIWDKVSAKGHAEEVLNKLKELQ